MVHGHKYIYTNRADKIDHCVVLNLYWLKHDLFNNYVKILIIHTHLLVSCSCQIIELFQISPSLYTFIYEYNDGGNVKTS